MTAANAAERSCHGASDSAISGFDPLPTCVAIPKCVAWQRLIHFELASPKSSAI